MSNTKARKGTPKPRNINPNPPKTLTKRDQAALKRVVARVLDDAQPAIDEIVETLIQEAMLYASGEDDPDYREYAEAALRIACESLVLPKLLAKTGKEVLTPDYVRSVVAGFC